MRDCDTLIIGAGMSGLAAGIRLAHFGQRVLLAERHNRIGGLNSWYERKGMVLESGLHAMTNYVPSGSSKHAPLMKLLRQLRIPYSDLALRPQRESAVVFPSATLRFSNDPALLFSEVERVFPSEVERFRQIWTQVQNFEDTQMIPSARLSARQVLKRTLREPLLIEMLMCPLSFYGSATEKDMDFRQFVTMFKAVFMEGFCRPGGGIRGLLDLLQNRFESSGGELALSKGIVRLEPEGDGIAAITEQGERIFCRQILSSAGYNETLSLWNQALPMSENGRLGYGELIVAADPETLDSPAVFACETIRFFSDSDTFNYSAPKSIMDFSAGVLCFPHRFDFQPGDSPPQPAVRMTALANPDSWIGIDPALYAEQKKKTISQLMTTAEIHTGLQNLEKEALGVDFFTPRTIQRYTGHINGAVYGSPHKQYDGRLEPDHLFLCGTDQGFLGIVGAMLSGISVANHHLLKI